MKKSVRYISILLAAALAAQSAACAGGGKPAAESGAEAAAEGGEAAGSAGQEGAAGKEGAAGTDSTGGSEENAEGGEAAGTAGKEGAADAEKKAADAEKVGLPAVGDVVEGFEVKEIRPFDMIATDIVLFEHQKTGAKLLYFANDDTNRVYDLTFLTQAIDNTGLPHVFEHATLNGSRKYPSSALFFNMIHQTYNTFLNASTYQVMTTYPCASLSEEQLLKYADFYTDSCLHPNIMEKESIYREEAWRYRLPDKDSPLTIEGTVYSEMLAAYNLPRAAAYNAARTICPGSYGGNVSGGDPAFIPDMTWEMLKEYHDRYYHPSNCVAGLYGDFKDYTAFLKILNEAFAPYERQEITLDDPGYQPISASVEKEFVFPAEKSSDTAHKTEIYYEMLLPGLKKDRAKLTKTVLLAGLLAGEASPLGQALNEQFPAASYNIYVENEMPESALVFTLGDANPEDAAPFRETVDRLLGEIAEQGFSDSYVDAAAASSELSAKLARENTGLGTDLIPAFMYEYACSGYLWQYLDVTEAVEQIRSWHENGEFRKILADLLAEEPVTALVTTRPEPGLKEKQDRELENRLAKVKASMSEEELQAVIDRSNAEKVPEDASEYIAKLKGVDVKSLPEEYRTYEVSDETDDKGIRRMSAEAEADGVGMPAMMFDASGLTKDDLHWFALYSRLVGQMDTSAHRWQELSELEDRYLNSFLFSMALVPKYKTTEFRPYLNASWTAAEEDLDEGYALLAELMYDTQFTDSARLLDLVRQEKNSFRAEATSGPYALLARQAFGASAPIYAFRDFVDGIWYYHFLCETEEEMEKDPSYAEEKLLAVQKYFRNSFGAVSTYAGTAEGIKTNRKAADSFLENLDNRRIEPVSWNFVKPARWEALIADLSVQFNGIVCDYKTAGLEEYSADMDALGSLIGDTYLIPMLREQYGVYSPTIGFNDYGVHILSYRDPNIPETFRVLEALPEFIRDMEFTQEDIDGYIMSAYAGLAQEPGQLSGAADAISDRMAEIPEDQVLTDMRQMKTLTPEKVKSYADAFARVMEDGLRYSAGGASVIRENSNLFDEILNPFAGEEELAEE